MYFQLCSASLQHGKAAGKEGTGQMAAAGARAQSVTQGLILHTSPRGGKTGHHVPLQQQCQSGGSIPGPRHPKPLSGSLWGISPAEPYPAGMLLSPGTRAFTPWCFACARGNLPARALPAGTGAECVAIGTFNCHEPIFFPRPGQALGELVPFQHTRSCSKVWALLLCVRQVTSPVLTCGLACREEGCC